MYYFPKATCIMSKYSNPAFIEKAENIQTDLGGPGYTMVLPPPTSVSPMITQMKVYQKESEEKNHKNAALLKIIRKQITDMLKLQCASVNGLAAGDVAFMLNSGFDLSKEPEGHSIPERAVIKSVLCLDDATAIIKSWSLLFCKIYELDITGPGGFKYYANGTYAHFKVSDLPLGVTLKAKIRGKNSKGVGQWSVSYPFLVSPAADESTEEGQ